MIHPMLEYAAIVWVPDKKKDKEVTKDTEGIDEDGARIERLKLYTPVLTLSSLFSQTFHPNISKTSLFVPHDMSCTSNAILLPEMKVSVK